MLGFLSFAHIFSDGMFAPSPLDINNYKFDRDESYTVRFVMVLNHGINYNINSKAGRSFSIASYSPSICFFTLLDLSNYKLHRDKLYTRGFAIVLNGEDNYQFDSKVTGPFQ